MSEIWDAVVIGAGVAGAVSAGILAGRGWRVLLVEKKTWPREKACGGCVNAGAVRMLEELGFGAALEGVPVLRRMRLCVGRRRLELELPEGRVVERCVLDASLVAEAVRRGCEFEPGVSARVVAEDFCDAVRRVELRGGDRVREVGARMVLACDGLGGGALAAEPWAAVRMDDDVRLGFSLTVAAGAGPRVELGDGEIGMYVGAAGYVGVSTLGDGLLHVGAALDPGVCHARGGSVGVMREIFAGCGVEWVSDGRSRVWGTGPLARHRERVAGHRVMAVGDACGYVEPFTGEGMAWAVRGAREAAALLRMPGEWHAGMAQAWQERHAMEIVQRQAWCRGIGRVLRWPRVAAGCVGVGRVMGRVPGMVAQGICT